MLEQLVPKKTQLVPKRRILVPKRKDFLMNEEILNTRGDQAFYMGAENAKIESAEKSAETVNRLRIIMILKNVFAAGNTGHLFGVIMDCKSSRL